MRDGNWPCGPLDFASMMHIAADFQLLGNSGGRLPSVSKHGFVWCTSRAIAATCPFLSDMGCSPDYRRAPALSRDHSVRTRSIGPVLGSAHTQWQAGALPAEARRAKHAGQ